MSSSVPFDSYMSSLIAADTQACMRAAEEIVSGPKGLECLYLDYVQPSQILLGEMWESGKISVAVEHVGTAINTRVVSSQYASIARLVVDGPRLVLTCTPGEQHSLGARLTADMLELNGWSVDFVGSSLPASDVLGFIGDRQPLVVGISAALRSNVSAVKKLISDIRNGMGASAPQIIVGGQAFWQQPNLWKSLGSDLWARDAVQAAAALEPTRQLAS